MNASELLQLVDHAFRDVEPPEAFAGDCPCGECEELEAALQGRPDELPDGIAWDLPLLSPEAMQFLTPRLIRESVKNSDSDLAGNLIDMFGTPISKSNPPDCLPFACCFNRNQTIAVLEFLRFVRGKWFSNNDEIPKQLRRGIVNWEHFAAQER